MNAKSDKYFAVSRAVLEVLENKGVDSISHSAIARASKVSRAWIYEYMGKEKSDLIDIAAEVFAGYFSKESFRDDLSTPHELFEHIKAGQSYALQTIKNEPLIIRLYFRYKGTNSPIGSCVKKYEKTWLEKMSKHFEKIMKRSRDEAMVMSRIILTMRLGLYHLVATSKIEEMTHMEEEILGIIEDRYFKSF